MNEQNASISAPQLQLLDHLRGTEMDLRVVVMAKKFTIEDLASLSPGSVLSFRIPITQPASVQVNGKRFADGEVVQINDHYGVRLQEFAG